MYLTVNGKNVEPKNLTYEELKILSIEFHNRTGEYPTQLNSKQINNLPSFNMTNSILEKNGKTRYEYLKEIGCNENKILNRYLSEDQRNKSVFPIELPDKTILYYDGYEEEKNNGYHKIHCHDQYNYKYRLTRKQIFDNIKRKQKLTKFMFSDKTFLEHNINNYLRLNNCIYTVYEIPEECTDKDPFYLISSYGEIIETRIYQMMHTKNRFTEEGRLAAIRHQRSYSITKDEVIQILRQKQEELNRPLKMEDLKDKELNKTLSRKVIEKYWNSYSEMIADLGLLKHGMIPIKNWFSKEQCIHFVYEICEKVKKSGRITIDKTDFVFDNPNISFYIIDKRLKENNIDIYELIKQNGCEYRNDGSFGNIHRFNDGEVAVSNYEAQFSSLLRQYGFVYNYTYFRNVMYREIDNNYDGKMNCDYKIVYGNKVLYVELAGMVYSQEKINKYNNGTLHDDILKKYINSLNLKEQMLINSNADYKIVLGIDLNEKCYKNIINELLLDQKKAYAKERGDRK